MYVCVLCNNGETRKEKERQLCRGGVLFAGETVVVGYVYKWMRKKTKESEWAPAMIFIAQRQSGAGSRRESQEGRQWSRCRG